MSARETVAHSLDETRSGPALLVLGMRRPGTSVLTEALQLCGARVCGASELKDANDESPRGFRERRDVRGTCDRSLLAAEADWWRVARFEPEAIAHTVLDEERARYSRIASALGECGTWALKEPRLCPLLPALRGTITNPVRIHIVPNPLDAARALKARDGFGAAAGSALSEVYNRRALSASKFLRRVLVSHESLALRPEEALERLIEELARLGATGLETSHEDRLSQLIDLSFYRRRASPEELPDFLSPPQLAFWQAFRSGAVFDFEASASGPPAARHHRFDLEAAQFSLQGHNDRARELNGALTTRNRTIVDLQCRGAALTVERDERQVQASAQVATTEGHQATIDAHKATIADLQRRTAELTAEREEQRAANSALEATIEARDATIRARDDTIRELLNSTSWKATQPLRVVSRTFRRSRRILRQSLRGALGSVNGPDVSRRPVPSPRSRRSRCRSCFKQACPVDRTAASRYQAHSREQATAFLCIPPKARDARTK